MSTNAVLVERKDFGSLVLAKWLATWGALLGTVLGGVTSFLGDTLTGGYITFGTVVVPVVQAHGFARKYPGQPLGLAVRRCAWVQFAYVCSVNVLYEVVRSDGWSPQSLQRLAYFAVAGCLAYGLTTHFILRRLQKPAVAPAATSDSTGSLAKKRRTGAILFAAFALLPLWKAVGYTQDIVNANRVASGATRSTWLGFSEMWLLFLSMLATAWFLARMARKRAES